MLTTNLLPSSEKKILKREETRRTILFFAVAYSAVFFLTSFLLLPTYLPLVVQRQELLRQLEIEEEASRKLGVEESIKELRSVSTGVVSLRTYASVPPRASASLTELLDKAGPGITINLVSVKKDGSVAILGSAARRGNLLALEKALRESGRFQEISSPLSNIIRETDINFSIEGKFKSIYSL